MLSLAWQAVEQRGYQIVNLDCIVFLQQPKLSPYKLPIRDRVAQLLGLPVDRVGLKAKTGESVGPVGREEAIMAECVVLLERKART
jgi:2-C-methyl-D-erythritol 2,4-cyclodiphosphate synthase